MTMKGWADYRIRFRVGPSVNWAEIVSMIFRFEMRRFIV